MGFTKFVLSHGEGTERMSEGGWCLGVSCLFIRLHARLGDRGGRQEGRRHWTFMHRRARQAGSMEDWESRNKINEELEKEK